MSANVLAIIAADGYLQRVLAPYEVPKGLLSPSFIIQSTAEPIIRAWASDCFNYMTPSGSYAKGTAIRGQSDMDLFVSLKSATLGNLRDIYESLFKYLSGCQLKPKKQNVSIGVEIAGYAVDIVPGKLHDNFTGDHSLYKNRVGSWCQTNVAKQIAVVKSSELLNEIRLTKLWRNVHSLDFPSFYLELSVILALQNRKSWSLANNFIMILKYLSESFETALVVDPASQGNRISDDLTQVEKLKVASCAERCLRLARFEDIVW